MSDADRERPRLDARTRAGHRPHVLIVTADEGLRVFLAEGLVLAGFWTSTVGSAVQTLEVFRLRSFDIVLVDAALGGIGALELVRRLRGLSDRAASDQARTDVPILIVAAETDEAPAVEVARAGADGVLVAPLELGDVAERLRVTVEQWREAHADRAWADEVAQRRPAPPNAPGPR